MLPLTTYIDSDKFRNDVNRIVFELFRNYEKVSSALTDELYPIRKDTLHFVGKFLKPKTSAERVVCRVLARGILQTESLAGGSAHLALVYALNLIHNVIRSEVWQKSNLTLETAYEKIMEEVKNDIQSSYILSNEEDLKTLADDICETEILSTVVLEALKLASIEGKIYVEDSKQANFVIERKTGYNFKTKPFKFFLNGSTNAWERQNVRALLVDGIVEKVSEIDQILRGAFEQKQPALIVARGFSEEVVATLKANFDRGTLDILPVRINSDLESINILNDIASVVGTDIVSTLKGEMICFKKWDELPLVERVRALPDQLTIEETRTKNQVMAQVQHLLNKRFDSRVEDVINLIDERIKSLTSDAVVIRLPNMTDVENQATRAKIDVFLRAAKAALNHNMVKLSDVVERMKGHKYTSGSFEDCILRAIETTKDTIEDKKTSCLSAYLAFHVAGKQALMLVTSNGAVLSDQEE